MIQEIRYRFDFCFFYYELFLSIENNHLFAIKLNAINCLLQHYQIQPQRMLSRAVRPLVTGSRYFHTSSTIFAQQLQSADDFKNKVLKSTKPVVVDYYAEYFFDHSHISLFNFHSH